MARQRKGKTMTPTIGHGKIMHVLPGSESMVGGPLLCMFHELKETPLMIDKWRCQSVYMHVAFKRPAPYNGGECMSVLNGVNAINNDHQNAFRALLQGEHLSGHPLPGVYTVVVEDFRVDFRVKEHNGNKHLWALVYTAGNW